MPLEQDVLDIGKQLEKIVADGNSVRFFYFLLFYASAKKTEIKLIYRCSFTEVVGFWLAFGQVMQTWSKFIA